MGMESGVQTVVVKGVGRSRAVAMAFSSDKEARARENVLTI